MEIQNYNNQTFTARNKTIRVADNIARRANFCYPRTSNTLLAGLNSAKDPKFKNLFINISAYIGAIRSLQFGNFMYANNFTKKLKSIVDPLISARVGNCSEIAELTTLIAKANGIKNAQMRNLITPDGQLIDHMVTYVADEKPYIIDGWLGFADYENNAIKYYQKTCDKYFNFSQLGTNKILTKELSKNFRIPDFKNQKFTPKEIQILQQTYPEFIIKK